MNFQEVIKNARENIGPYCKACGTCNGRTCKTPSRDQEPREPGQLPYEIMKNGRKSVLTWTPYVNRSQSVQR